MPEPRYEHRKRRILALLWHAPHRVIAAGGFRRAYEILYRAPGDVEVLAIDDSPSFLRGLSRDNVSVTEYGIPGFVRSLEKRAFWLERAIEWTLSTLLMAVLCVRFRAKGEHFDAVFVPSSEQIPALLTGILAKHLFGTELVVCSTNLDIFPSAIRKPIARLHNQVDTLIPISEHLEKEFESYGVLSRMVVNGVGLDAEAIASIADPAGKDYDAVFVGRHDREKGVFDLIQIWNLVRRELPSARLLMIGSCNPHNKARLTSLIAELGLGDNVTMVGMVDDPTKYSFMKRSKVCLFPSYVEEWGIVPQEALACGLPVTVYDLPVYEENIKWCEAVFRAPVGDIKGIARRTVELLSEGEYLKFANTGPAFVTRFSWDDVAKQEFEILLGHSLLASGGAGKGVAAEKTIKRVLNSPPSTIREGFKFLAVCYCRLFKSSKTFRFQGREYSYFFHPHNLAWRNERSVEIPIAQEFLSAHSEHEILEVGNVLSHYLEVEHDILDKYEVAEAVINEDAVEFDPAKKYDLIICISTLEHIGWDETPRDPGKLSAAIENLVGLLAPEGELMATVPIGYNPEFDCLIEQRQSLFTEVIPMRRLPGTNQWVETNFESVRGARYKRGHFRASAIIVGRIKRGRVEEISDGNSS